MRLSDRLAQIIPIKNLAMTRYIKNFVELLQYIKIENPVETLVEYLKGLGLSEFQDIIHKYITHIEHGEDIGPLANIVIKKCENAKHQVQICDSIKRLKNLPCDYTTLNLLASALDISILLVLDTSNETFIIDINNNNTIDNYIVIYRNDISRKYSIIYKPELSTLTRSDLTLILDPEQYLLYQLKQAPKTSLIDMIEYIEYVINRRLQHDEKIFLYNNINL